MTRIIAIASQKGGVGKTTTAVNLAAFLQLAGRRTLLMDADPQGNATSGIGAERSRRPLLLDLLNSRESWDSCVSPTDFENLFVLPAFTPNPDPAYSTPDIEPSRVAELHSALLAMEPRFDKVIIDCPPSFGPLPRFALQLADSVLIPVQSEYYAMEGLSQILPLIERIDRTRERSLEIEGLLLTMFSEELELSFEVMEEIRRYFPDDTMDTVIPRDVSLAEAASHGVPISTYDVRSRGCWAYMNLAKEILEHEHEEAR